MSSTPHVNILLSTYNGEAYLAEQLDSLLAQTYQNLTIYIRDDGSTDKTLSIIQTYLAKSQQPNLPPIILLNQDKKENLGFMKSFWTLLKECEAAEYYAFCDQDDYWLPNKIELGVQALAQENPTLPLLYSSSFAYHDENMKFTGNPSRISTPVTFKDGIFYTPAFGFTIMINETLRKIAVSSSDLTNIPHDGWCQKIAASMGKFVYDETQTARYRRHSTTVTYANSNKWNLIKKWIQNDILGIGLTEYHFVLRRFQEEYGDQLNSLDQNCLKLFKEQPLRLSLYFKRLFYPQRLRPTLGGELALRLCFMLGK